MQRTEMIDAIKQLLDHADAGTTDSVAESTALAAERFLDPDRLERERDALFLRYPQVVGMGVDLAPGHYATQTVAGVQVLLTRDRGGEFHAFLNACRHRGTTVAEGCGKARNLVCPWHAWSYDLRGALVGVAHASTFGDIDKATNGLIELPSAERHGMLFVVPTPGADLDIDTALGDLGPELGDFNFESLHLVSERTAKVDLNWKLGNDTGFELYHVAYLHKDSVGAANIGNTGLYRQFGYNHRMTAISPAAKDLRSVPESEWQPMDHLQFIYNVFPSAGLVVSSQIVALTRLDPGPTPGTSLFRFASYSWAPLDDSTRPIAEMINEFLYNVVSKEDFPTAERTQANLDSGLIDELLVGRNEPAIVNAHKSYDAALETATAQSKSPLPA